MKNIIFVFSLFLSSAAHSISSSSGVWDYSYSFGLRSQPIGLGVAGELGYSHLLYGTPSAKPHYGYLRPFVAAQTSGLVNRADVGMGVALWSPVEFVFSYAWDHRNNDFDAFDCEVLQCRGLLTRTKVGANLTFGYGDYFLLWDSRMEIVKSPDAPVRDFGDHSWNLRGVYNKDTLLNTKLTLGKVISEAMSVGALAELSIFKESEEESKNYMGFVTYKSGGLRYFIGAGIYESTRFERTFTTSIGASYSGGDSFSLR